MTRYDVIAGVFRRYQPTPTEARFAEIFGGVALILVTSEGIFLLILDLSTFEATLRSSFRRIVRWFTGSCRPQNVIEVLQ